jgi:hypothetical protein
MNEAALTFQFADIRSAYQAFDTLEELGYRPVLETIDGLPAVHIAMEGNDLTSALEIAQVHGGNLTGPREEKIYDDAYGLQSVPVPAHIVNEDRDEAYMHPDETNHFSAEVRI